jgi:chromosome segregation ATPase
MTIYDRNILTEKTSELIIQHEHVIDCLEEEIQEFKARIQTLEKREQELEKQVIKAEKDSKLESETRIRNVREHIDELKNTISEKNTELHNAKEAKLDLSHKFEKLMTEMKDDLATMHKEGMTDMKNELTRKHEEHMTSMKAELTKQYSEVLKQNKEIQSMLSNITKQMPYRQYPGQQNSRTNAMQKRPTKSEPNRKERF